jgi:mRNA interferase YafQ
VVEKNPPYQIQWTSQYKKDIKRAKKRNYDMEELYSIVSKLANDEPLEERLHDHALNGKWAGHRELHIRPDWLLIYQKKDNLLILELTRTGTHADLFDL